MQMNQLKQQLECARWRSNVDRDVYINQVLFIPLRCTTRSARKVDSAALRDVVQIIPWRDLLHNKTEVKPSAHPRSLPFSFRARAIIAVLVKLSIEGARKCPRRLRVSRGSLGGGL